MRSSLAISCSMTTGNCECTTFKEKKMKNRTVIASFLALSVALSGTSFAQPRPDTHNDNHRKSKQEQRHDKRHDSRNEHRNDRQQQNRKPHVQKKQNRGAGPHHEFHRGGHLPHEYRHHQYVVNDWRNHHLSAPPRGYHWVQTGTDYVLIAIATGIIAQVVLGN
ncbi:RcnB family protein [Oxalicibacterium flavum]|nr:RcnB family protein [Oxalicibacterium flavum]